MESKIRRAFLARLVAGSCLWLMLPAAGLHAQSVEKPATSSTLPRVVAFDDVRTAITLFNPNLREASVKLTPTDAVGRPASGAVTIAVPPRSQVSRTASDLFGIFPLDISLGVTSDAPGIVTTFQTFDSGRTFLDGADAAGADFNLVYPIVPGAGEGAVEIDIHNPNIRPTSVELKLWNSGGDLLGKTTLQVPAGGTYRNLAHNAFPESTSFTGASHVTATSKPINIFSQPQSLDGTSLFAGFSSVPGPGGAADIAAVNASSPAQLANTGVIPFFRTGSTHTSTLALVNAEPASVDVDLTAVGTSGIPYGSRTINLKANGGFRARLQSAFPSLVSGEKEGWILVRASGRVFAGIINGRSDAPSLAVVPMQRTPKLEFIIPQILQNAEQYTELALANPGSVTATADLYLVKSNGDTVASAQVSLSPGAALIKNIGELMPEARSQFGGYLYARASGPLFGTALTGSLSGSFLAGLGPQALSVAFSPAPRRLFAIWGTVSVNGTPEPGVKLALSGPVRRQTTSAADGFYLFSDLPAGTYQLSVESDGSYEFFPSQVSLELGTASLRKDFDGFKKSEVWGTVILDGKPAPGFRLLLSGAVHLQATSAEDGSYRFQNLPAGNYSLVIEFPKSIQFVPTRVELQLSRALKRQDFQGFTKPTVWGIVTMNGQPAAGFHVVLVGATEQVAQSGTDGSYLFKFVDAGTYTLSIRPEAGFQFAPSQVSIAVERTSIQLDFQGYTLPGEIVVRPSAFSTGSPDSKAAVFGTDFTQTSSVLAGFTRLKTTLLDSTRLEVVLPAFMLATPSYFELRVVTQISDFDEIQSKPFAVVAYPERPNLKSILTAERVLENAAGATLTLTGAGFLQGAAVKINGSSDGIRATRISEEQLLVEVPARYLEHGGVYPVTVLNPYPAGSESNMQLLTVYYPAPAVQGVSPGALPVRLEEGEGPAEIAVSGYGFRRGAFVLFNGEPLATTYCERDAYCLAVQLYAKIPAGKLRNSGFAQLVVRNPDPSVGASEVVFLRMDGLLPTITSVLPGTATALPSPGEFSVPIVVNGTNFGPQTAIEIYQVGTPRPGFSPGRVRLIGSTQLYTNVPIGSGSIGEWVVQVSNPQPGGGLSLPMSFYITRGTFEASPFLIALSPPVVPLGSPAFTLTISGSNFKAGAQVMLLSKTLVTTVLSDSLIQAEVPASMLVAAGKVPVSVVNPDTGGASNRLYLEIR